jgi:hypothetical protein
MPSLSLWQIIYSPWLYPLYDHESCPPPLIPVRSLYNTSHTRQRSVAAMAIQQVQAVAAVAFPFCL